MKFTGERYVPSENGIIKYEHLHRYAAAQNFCVDKIVLDLSSGEGYGTAFLSSVAKSVYGVDIDPQSIKHSTEKYSKQYKNLKFILGACENIPLPDASIDVVTSFETIEHHDKHEEMMQEIQRVLKPDGILIISSPNKLVYSDEPNYQNPYHIKELYYEELKILLDRYFKYVSIFGQRMASASFVTTIEDSLCHSSSFTSFSRNIEHLEQKTVSFNSPVYFLAICSNTNPQVLDASIYIDAKDDLYQQMMTDFSSVIKSEHQIKESCQQLQSQFEQSQRELREAQVYFQRAQTDFQQSQENYQQLQARFEQSQRELREAQVYFQRAQTEFQQSQENYQQLQARFEQSQRELREAQVYFQQSQESYQHLQSRFEQSQRELRQTQFSFQQSQENYQHLQSHFEQSQAELQQTKSQLQQATERIIAMESSKFWQLRKFWFQCKQVLGLKTNEPLNSSALLKKALKEKQRLNPKVEECHSLLGEETTLKLKLKLFFYRSQFLFWRAVEILLEEGIFTLFKRVGISVSKSLNNNSQNIDLKKSIEKVEQFDTPQVIYLKTSSNPTVSIIIPVYNNFLYTFNCLKSLQEEVEKFIYVEVIVVDDASTDETKDDLNKIQGITVIRNQKNAGFIHSCNRGAKNAKGRYLCFLNNDTRVLSGWLHSLMKAIESDDTVGAVGSQLIYPDGRLQEAGGIIWQDATGWNYGRLQSPDDPEYNYVREVDYCSGASLLVKANLFHQLKGFSETFLPAYYEDTDLCFAIRRLGYKVLYQPKSKLIHYEGITSGKDTSGGIKKYQDINREKFLDKWKKQLQNHLSPNANNVFQGARRLACRTTILIVDSYIPLHDRESGSYRLFNIIKILIDLGYTLIFCPDNATSQEPYTSELQEMGVEVLYFTGKNSTLKEQLRSRLPFINIAWICRPELANKYIDLVRQNSKIKIIYDTIDLHFIRLQRQLAFDNTDQSNSEEWKQMKNLELQMAQSAHTTLVVTPVEKKILSDLGIPKVQVVPNIHNPYTGEIPPFQNRSGLLFIGGYNHTPNIDAVLWLCQDIMPLVWQIRPDIHLTLLGSDPPQEVRSLENDKVTVTGYIQDVEPYFLKSLVFVAPLRYGAGMKGKIGHSLSYGLPVITTSIGAEGIGLTHGTNAIISDQTDEISKSILELSQDSQLWQKISCNSLTFIQQYSSVSLKQKVKNILDTMIEL